MADRPRNRSLPPVDREIEVNHHGYTRAFYQDGYWFWVSIDPFLGEMYHAGPTPTWWREIEKVNPSTSVGN